MGDTERDINWAPLRESRRMSSMGGTCYSTCILHSLENISDIQCPILIHDGKEPGRIEAKKLMQEIALFFNADVAHTSVHDCVYVCIYCYYYIHRNLNQNGSPLSQRDTGEQSIQFYSYLHHCKPMRNKKKIIHSDQFHNYLFFSSFILSWLSC